MMWMMRTSWAGKIETGKIWPVCRVKISSLNGFHFVICNCELIAYIIQFPASFLIPHIPDFVTFPQSCMKKFQTMWANHKDASSKQQALCLQLQARQSRALPLQPSCQTGRPRRIHGEKGIWFSPLGLRREFKIILVLCGCPNQKEQHTGGFRSLNERRSLVWRMNNPRGICPFSGACYVSYDPSKVTVKAVYHVCWILMSKTSWMH